MPIFRNPFQRRDRSVEARFETWTDRLSDPRSLPGSGNTPDPDPDFADVAETATTVYRSVGIGAATQLPSDRADAIWEQQMSTTTVSPIVTPGLTTGDMPARHASNRSPSNPAPGWQSYLLTAALIAAIVVAGFATIWRITDPLDGRGPGAANQPGFLAAATPARESAEGCPLTSDMYVVIDEEPFLGDFPTLTPTTALVRANGDLVITCVNVEDPEPLISGVTDATSLSWPGTVMLELENGSAIAYNIATDQRLELGEFEVAAVGGRADLASPWLVTPNNFSHTDWRITNLETMKSTILSEEIGGLLPDPIALHVSWYPGSPVAAFTAERGVPRDDQATAESPPDTAPATVAELPGNSLVVDETFETRRWIDSWGEIAVGADGEVIAYQNTDPVGPLKVEDSRTGETLAEMTTFNLNNRSPARFAFAGDGESLVYLNGNNVWLATYRGEPAISLLETGDMRPSEVHPTGVPGRVLIKRLSDLRITTPALFNGALTAISILDTSAGSVTDLDGVPVPYGYGYGLEGPWKHLDHVVTMSPASAPGEMTVMQLVDIATGEVVLRSDPVEMSMQMLVDQSVQAQFVQGGAITVVNVAGGPSLLFDVGTGTVSPIPTERLSDIDGYEDTVWVAVPTSDGGYLTAFGYEEATETGFVTVSRLSLDPVWVFPPTVTPVALIPAIPVEEVDGEPATLKAQEIAPLDASPAATPAS